MFNLNDTATQRNRTAILLGMHALGKPVYAGTVDPDVIAERRARNRRARAARRITRRYR